MFETISRSFRLLKLCLHVLAVDKELILFPVFSSIGVILVSLSFMGVGFGIGAFDRLEEGTSGVIDLFVLFAFYVASYFVLIFFNSALVYAAHERLAGGDPGHPGLYGGAAPPAPRKPMRLVRLEMAGWARTDDATKAAFEEVVAGLAASGVEIFAKGDDPAIDEYEALLARMPELWRDLYRFEMRWPMLQYLALYPDDVPPRLKRGLEEGAGLTQETYRTALVRRAHARNLHSELAERADGFVTLASPGPGPVGMDQGSAIFNEPSSVMGAPALSLPLMAVDGVPVGVQLMGRIGGDEALTACGLWVAEHVIGRPA